MASWIFSKRFPVPHAFTTREGGVSKGPYASLNLGTKVGDDPSLVEENHRIVCRAADVSRDRLYTVSQVHGDAVVEASSHPVEADALWTAEEGAAVGVRVADCVPILIADPVGRRVMAVHSGWRGTARRIGSRAVEHLLALGADASRLVAAIGPAIGLCCYEIGEDLARRFADAFGPDVIARDDGPPHLDLQRAVKRTLLDAGLREENIDVLRLCTSCDRRFYSHRRDRGRTGRHLAYAVCRF